MCDATELGGHLDSGGCEGAPRPCESNDTCFWPGLLSGATACSSVRLFTCNLILSASGVAGCGKQVFSTKLFSQSCACPLQQFPMKNLLTLQGPFTGEVNALEKMQTPMNKGTCRGTLTCPNRHYPGSCLVVDDFNLATSDPTEITFVVLTEICRVSTTRSFCVFRSFII